MAIKWIPDLPLESRARECGATFEIQTVNVKDIDVYGSRRNNARLSSQWDPDLSEQYARAMKEGSALPTIAVRRLPDGSQFQYMVMSGNHRLGAILLLEEAQIPVYIVTGVDFALDLLTRGANRWCGSAISEGDAILQAREIMSRYHRPASEIAGFFHLKLATLQQAVRAEETREELERLGVNARELSRAAILSLATLQSDTSVFKRAGFVATHYRMTAERVKEMATEAKRQRTEKDRLDVIAQCEATLKEEEPVSVLAPPKRRRPTKTRFYQALNTLISLLQKGRDGKPFQTLEQLGVLSVQERAEVREKLRMIDTILSPMIRAADETYKARKRGK